MDIENNNIIINTNPSLNNNLTSTTQTPINLNNIELPTNNVNNIQNFNTDWNTQKPKKWRKLLFFFLGILVWIALFVAYSAWTSYQSKKEIKDLISYYQNLSDEWHENQTSGLYSFTSSWSYNGEATYWLQTAEWNNFDYESYLNWDNSSLLSWYAGSREAKIKDNPWIEWLYDFRSFIYLDLTFSGSTLLDRDIVEKSSKESLGKLTVDELDKKYNYEASHEINELDIDKEDIKLSELKEGEIYQYTIKAWNYTSPKFTNDLNKTVIFYKKDDIFDRNSLKYDSNILLEGESEGGWYGVSSNEHTYNIYYKIAAIEEVLKEIWDDDIIYLSKYNTWEQISFRWEEQTQENWGILRVWALGDYMYNDTEETLTIKILDEHFGEIEERDIVEIQPWELYERYWAAEAFIISNEKLEKETNSNGFTSEISGNEVQNYYEDNDEIEEYNNSELQAVQARIRDVNRKNNLAQLQVAIITSQSDHWMRPWLENNIWNNWFTDADKWAQIKDITDNLYEAWMSSIPTDQDNEILAYWLGAEYRTKDLAEKNWAKWEYLYLVSTRNSIKWGGFVLMTKTETEEWSNWVVCKNSNWLENWYIKRGVDIKDIQTCQTITKWDTCTSNAISCTYTDEEELRYIILY